VRELAAATAALVVDHDVIGSITNLLRGCAGSVGATAAGIIMTTPDGGLEFLGATNHRAEHLEVYQVQVDEGPGIDCTSAGQPVTVFGLTRIATRWPSVHDQFLDAGFEGVHAAPMIWQGQTLGAVNLFFADDNQLDEQDMLIAQAFADIACLVVVRIGPTTRAAVAAQTRAALEERAVIERAKGVIAYSENLPMDAAFDRLVTLARSAGHPLTTVAAEIVDQAAEHRH
jgi:hypothetical protein